MAMDSSGRPAVLYSSSAGLKIALWKTDSWEHRTVDLSTTTERGSLYVDVYGRMAASYFDRETKDLKCARLSSLCMKTETVEAEGHAGTSNSVFLDPVACPVIAYKKKAPDSDDSWVKIARRVQ